jgi:hypothetical protein
VSRKLLHCVGMGAWLAFLVAVDVILAALVITAAGGFALAIYLGNQPIQMGVFSLFIAAMACIMWAPIRDVKAAADDLRRAWSEAV